MTNYREILRLSSLGFSQQDIAYSANVSKKTVNRVLKRARELDVSWPLDNDQTNETLAVLFFPVAKKEKTATNKRMPNYDYIHQELRKNGVNKKLLWTEYLEECRLCGEEPLMYSRFCYYIQRDEEKRRASMHIGRKPGERVEVDWAGDPAYLTDPDTGEITKVSVFVGVMSYSQYVYAEAFLNENERAWITAHIHMYEYFGGVARILTPDNCKTAVIRKGNSQHDPRINETYRSFAEHYGTAIIPARVRAPKDKPNAEGSVRHISTWIVAALRNEQFFSLSELNQAIRKKLDEFNLKPFQKKDGSRSELFHNEELPCLAKLPTTSYELADWSSATVQFNYHIYYDGMLYSVPYEYIKKKVDIRSTDKIVEIFYKGERIATHPRVYGRKGQYSTDASHMPDKHQKYLEWSGSRFKSWAAKIGTSTETVVKGILASHQVEEQGYRACMGLLKLSEKFSPAILEAACKKALTYTGTPSYRSVRNIIDSCSDDDLGISKQTTAAKGITRGAKYYGGTN